MRHTSVQSPTAKVSVCEGGGEEQGGESRERGAGEKLYEEVAEFGGKTFFTKLNMSYNTDVCSAL